MSLEHKNLTIDGVHLKFDDGESPGKFSGYASVFGGVDAYGDTIIPGAYKKTLKKRDRPVMLRWNHYGPIIGKWLSIEEDEKGLYVEGELTLGHSVADDAYALLKHGAVTGLSIGYYPRKYTDTVNEDGRTIRELKEIELVEVSIVETPADLSAQVGDIKSKIDEADSLKEIETILRDAGRFSRADATALVGRIKSMTRRECDQETQEQAEKQAEKQTSKTIADELSSLTNRLFKGE